MVSKHADYPRDERGRLHCGNDLRMITVHNSEWENPNDPWSRLCSSEEVFWNHGKALCDFNSYKYRANNGDYCSTGYRPAQPGNREKLSYCYGNLRVLAAITEGKDKAIFEGLLTLCNIIEEAPTTAGDTARAALETLYEMMLGYSREQAREARSQA